MQNEIHFDYRSRLKEICAERGISNYQLWQMSGTCRSTYYNLSSGKTLAPKTCLIYAICDAIDMDISTFFTDEKSTRTAIPVSRQSFVEEICTMDESTYNRLKGYYDSIKELKN